MGLFELNEKLTVARQNAYLFDKTKKLTKKFSNQSQINTDYYLKHHIPIKYRHVFRKLSDNREYVQTHCNNLNNPFHSACRKWYF